jgi:hypothetical protein
MPYGSTSCSASFGALARSTGLRLRPDRLTRLVEGWAKCPVTW